MHPTSRLPFFILLLLLPGRLCAQTDFRPGYIVLSAGDTLRGLVDYRGDVRNAKMCHFKRTSSEAATKYSPFDLLSYGFPNHKSYDAKNIVNAAGEQERLFLEAIEKGRVNLYYYKEEPEALHYYLSKGDGELFELIETKQTVYRDTGTYVITNKRYLGIMDMLMGDYRKITPRFKRTSLEHQPLAALVRDYNRSFITQSPAYSSTSPLFRVRAGALAGVQYTSIRFRSGDNAVYRYLNESDFGMTQSPVFGAFFNTTLSKVNQKFSLQFELLYQDNQFVGSRQRRVSLITTYQDVALRIRYLKLPVLVRYTFPTGVVRPYLNAGVAYAQGRVVENYLNTERDQNGMVEMEEGVALNVIRKNQQSLLAGFGLTIPVLGKYAVFAEARYEKGNGINRFFNRTEPNSRTTSFNFLAGFGF